MRALIIIPTYNERENILLLTQQIFQVVPQGVDVLVVDDGSPDGTGALCDEFAQSEKRFHILHRAKKMGLGTAYIAGFRWGLQQGFDYLIEMDADFSHDPKYLPMMLAGLETHDVVIGSRYVPGGGTRNWGFGRRLLSRGGGFYARTLLGAPIRDFTGGFNGWRRAVIESLNIDTLLSDGYSFQIELKYRAFLQRFRIHEFPIIFVDRKLGRSKMSRRIVIEALARVWTFRVNSYRYLRQFAAKRLDRK